MTRWFAAFLILTASGPASAAECPSRLVLSGPRFVNHERFPTDQQIQNNFNLVFTAPGEPQFKTWNADDLKNAVILVRTLERAVQGDQITLEPKATPHGCVGKLDGLEYSVNKRDGILFSLEGNFDRDFATIATGVVHSRVEYNIALPSNCSGCAHSTELFEFTSVSR